MTDAEKLLIEIKELSESEYFKNSRQPVRRLSLKLLIKAELLIKKMTEEQKRLNNVINYLERQTNEQQTPKKG